MYRYGIRSSSSQYAFPNTNEDGRLCIRIFLPALDGLISFYRGFCMLPRRAAVFFLIRDGLRVYISGPGFRPKGDEGVAG